MYIEQLLFVFFPSSLSCCTALSPAPVSAHYSRVFIAGGKAREKNTTLIRGHLSKSLLQCSMLLELPSIGLLGLLNARKLPLDLLSLHDQGIASCSENASMTPESCDNKEGKRVEPCTRLAISSRARSRKAVMLLLMARMVSLSSSTARSHCATSSSDGRPSGKASRKRKK